MVAFYKHDIPAWMDGTESLDSAESYRTYHVIVQLIYQNEGPIKNNEHGIAGRCRQSLKTYRAALANLIKLEKLKLDERGRIDNGRASIELQKIDEQRIKAGRGGKNSAGRPKSADKPLENKAPATPLLLETNSIKDKTILDKTTTPVGVEKRATRLPSDWKPKADDIAEAKRVLGAQARAEFQKFCDYWKAQPGQRGVKADWDATWRNWVRKAGEMGHGKTQRGTSLLDAIDRALEQSVAEDAHSSAPENPILRLPK